VDHRVEPPAWLPQGAAPEAADPETDDSPAVGDAQATEGSDAAPAEDTPEEFTNGNGHDSSFTYSRDDSYHYGDDSPFADTSYRSPFTPHRSAGTSYEPEEPAAAEGELPGTDSDATDSGGTESDGSDDLPETDAARDKPDSSFSPGSGYPSDSGYSSGLGGGMPDSGGDDPATPGTGWPGVGSGYRGTGSSYSDSTATPYTDGSAPPYTDTTAAPYTDTSAPRWSDTSSSPYTDTSAAPYSAPYADTATTRPYTDTDTTASRYGDPGRPYPVTEPAGSGTASGAPDRGFGSGGADTAGGERRTTFATATAATATAAAGLGAALRAGKEKGAAKFARNPGSKSRTSPPRTSPSRTGTSQARRANLVIARVEPWSVMKFSFLISLVLWVVLFVAVALLYYALSSLGVFAALQRTLVSVTSSQTSAGVDLSKWTSATRVLGYTMLLGAVDVVLITAISTVGAVVYNLVTHLGGGIEVTLKETE
jgi:hypothetical protein